MQGVTAGTVARLVRDGARPVAGCAVAIMAKASTPGVCKTRLIATLGGEGAAALNTAFLQDIVGNLEAAARLAPVAAYLAFGPLGAAEFFESRFAPPVGLIEVADPDFGLCLRSTLERLFALGHEAACVLNSDSPTLPTAVLAQAARLLAEPGDRAVLGPSIDGGYYLLGLKAPHARLFEDIAWSTDAVAAQTRARAAEISLPLVELPEWYDVDDAEMLGRLLGELAGRATPDAYGAPHTAALLSELGTAARSRAAATAP